MKKLLCFLLAMLLLAGCANTQSPPDTTEKKPGWSVSGSEPGDATQSSELTDEELLEQDKDQEQMELEFDEEGNPVISGNAGGGSGGSGEVDHHGYHTTMHYNKPENMTYPIQLYTKMCP